MQKKTDRDIKNFPQYKPMPSRHVVLACRPAQLHHFWHVDIGDILACRRAHFSMSTEAFWHVDGHIYYFTLYYFSFPAYFLASRAIILACRRAHFACRRAQNLLFYTLLFFLSSLLFGIAGRDFDMSTGASCTSTGAFAILHFTIFLFHPTFGITGRHFGMSTGTFCMSTGTFTILHFTNFPFLPTFWHRGPSF